MIIAGYINPTVNSNNVPFIFMKEIKHKKTTY